MAQFTQNQRYGIIVPASNKSNSGGISSLLFLPPSKFWPVDVAIFVQIIIFKNIVNYTGIVLSIDKFFFIFSLSVLLMLAMVMIFILCKDWK